MPNGRSLGLNSSLAAYRFRGLPAGNSTALRFAAAVAMFSLVAIPGGAPVWAQQANEAADPLTAGQYLELLERQYASDRQRLIGALAIVAKDLGCPANFPFQRRLLELIERRDGPKSENASNALANLADCLLDTDDTANAVAAWERLLVLDEELHGEARVTAKTLNNLAVAYKRNGQLDRAEQAYRRSLSILLRTVPDTDPYLEKALENLAHFYASVGREKDALPYQQKQLAELRARLPAPADPPLSSIELDVLRGKVVTLTKQARFAEALNVAERLLAVTETQFGKESPESAEVVGRIGLISKYAGDYNRAERQYTQALEMLDRLPDRGGQLRARVEQNLGMLYLEQQLYLDAEPILKRVLKNAEQELTGNPNLAYAYNDLGLLYYRLRRYSDAEPLLAKALSIRESAVGIDKDLVAISLDNLGLVYLDTERFPEAERLISRALKLFGEALGATHPDTLIALMNLASVWERTDQLQRALDLLTSAVDETVTVRGEGHPSSVKLLQRRGLLHDYAGRLSLAQADLLRALSAAENTSSGDAEAARILVALSGVYIKAHDYSGADEALERAERINERLRIFDDWALALLYKQRGRALLNLQNRGGAADYLEKSLKINERIRPANDPMIAIELNNLATTIAPSDLERARSLLIQSIAINEANRCDCIAVADAYNNLGSVYEQLGAAGQAEAAYLNSVGLSDRLLGAAHPKTITAQSNLALLLATMARTDEAVVLAEARAAGFEQNLLPLLTFGTLEQRHLFVRSQNPFSLFGTFGVARPIAQAVIRYKGVVTESVLSEHRAAGRTTSPERAAAIERWRDARRALTQATVEDSAGPRRPGEAGVRERAMRDRLRAQLTEAEAELARLGSAPVDSKGSFAIRVSDVQAKIPSDAVLLDFVRYSHYLGKAKQEDRYGVIVLASRGDPEWVPLGNAWEIEQLIDRLYHVIRGSDPVNTIRGVVRVLHGRLLEPVIPFVPKTAKRLLVVPDGDVNFVPFAALLTHEDRLVAEKYSITYLSSARDLLRGARGPAAKQMAIYANPSFRVRPPPPARAPILFAPEFQYPTLRPLPFTVREAKAIAGIAAKNGWRTALHTGQDASERTLFRAETPGILHLATHGFVLPRYGMELVLADDDSRAVGGVRQRPVAPSPRPSGGQKRPMGEAEAYRKGLITTVKVMSSTDPAFEDPMLRSAMALAGAQDTLEAWRSGQVPRMAQDGILNAEEAAMLDLEGTWLVTLSSCDSGLGDAEPGEGIVGLRRGFLQAGAQAILTTLWPVDDAVTASLMADFYRKALQSGDASTALADVQRRLLTKFRKERGLDQAVRLAGAFVVTSRTAPSPQ